MYIYIYIYFNHFAVQQKLTQHCKSQYLKKVKLLQKNACIKLPLKHHCFLFHSKFITC